ncbi:MAG: type IV pilus secretin PilQ [Nitrospirae bacterium]|nr:type IV pilus secretin PilQ [Nitrospirota bacterium]
MMNRFRLRSFFISIVLASMVSIIYSSCSPRVSQVKTEEMAALEVNDVRLSDSPDKTEVIVTGSGHIPYTTFRLTDPPRLILDLAGTSLGSFKEKIETKGGAVVSIIPKEGQKPNMVSRLEIVLTGLAESNVRRDRDSLIVEILKAPAKAEEAREGGGIPEEAKAETKGLEPQMAEEKVLPPARNISKIDIDKSEKGIKVTVTGDGEMKPNTFIVGERRLVFDIPDTMSQVKPTSIQVDHPILKRIRIGQHKDPEKVRIVFDLNKLTPYIIDKKGDQFIVFLGESIPTKVTVEERPEVTGKEAPKVAEAPLPETKPAEMIQVAKEEVPEQESGVRSQESGKIPKMISPPTVEESGGKVAEITPVAPPLEIKKEVHQEIPDAKEEKPKAIKEVFPEISKAQEEIPKKEMAPPSPAKEERAVKVEEAISAKKYKGRKISLDFQDAEITSILRLLADVSVKNMVIAEDVKGKRTLKLLNVPWDQALDIVLKMNNLGKVEEESVIRIGTLGSLARQQEEEAKAKESMIKAEDLVTKVININYAKAHDLSETLKKNLSARGDITIDARTNSMIIKDVEKIIIKISDLVKILDTPTPQVMIEARIVQAKPDFVRELGVQWGADLQAITGSNAIGISAGPTGDFGSPTSTFGVNLPAAAPTGTLGFTFGRLTGNPINLDLRLSASETKGMTKIISSPKITTLDNQEAKIEQGESIPFATTSQQGTQTTFVDANLTLAVTPHVTSDGSIIMKVKASKNAPGSTRTGAAGPSIDKKEAFTNVLIKDGETVVIGGIYENSKIETVKRVPFLSSIPILGWLFRNESISDSTTELLVFITPKIIK